MEELAGGVVLFSAVEYLRDALDSYPGVAAEPVRAAPVPGSA